MKFPPPDITEIFVEALEARIAPATLVNPKTVTYTDLDGDTVTVKISKGVLTESMFAFDGNFGDTGPQVLGGLDLTSLQFKGASLTVTAKSAGGGDGFVDIGEVLATGNALGKVQVDGGLTKITAGDGVKGITTLQVRDLGMSDPADFGLADRSSAILGKVGALNASRDVGGLFVVGGGEKAAISKITIGGSLIAGAGSQSAWIEASGGIGPVKIGGNIDGRLADSDNEAGINSLGKLGNVAVGGSIIAGSSDFNGVVLAALSAGNIKVGGNVGKDATNTVAAGDNSGSIIVYGGKAGTISVGGSLLGGAGDFSGHIAAASQTAGSMGKVQISGAITGGDGDNSGGVFAGTTLAGVSVGTNLAGGAGKFSGSIVALQTLGAVKVGGNVAGGDGEASGFIQSESGKVTDVMIGGNLTGGEGIDSGSVQSTFGEVGKVTVNGVVQGGEGARSGSIIALMGKLGTVSIGKNLSGTSGALMGGAGAFSGSVFGMQGIASVSVNGDVVGGADSDSGTIQAGPAAGIIGDDPVEVIGNIGKIWIAGDLQGDTGLRSGTILAWDGSLGTTSIGGSIIGDEGDLSGTIFAQRGISSITVTEELSGGTGDDAGTIQTGSAQAFGGVNILGNIGKVWIGGDAQGNDGLRSGSVLAWGSNMGQAFIGGSVLGGDGQFSALIYGMNTFTKAEVRGDVIGGDVGSHSGRIATDTGVLGTVIIGGKVQGGAAASSGTIYAGTDIRSVSIGQDLIGGSATDAGAIKANGGSLSKASILGKVQGGTAANSGTIYASKDIGSVSVGQDLLGGTGAGAGSIISSQAGISKVQIGGKVQGSDGERSGMINASNTNGRIGTVSIGDSVTGGKGFLSGSIWGQNGISSVFIDGDLQGGTGGTGDSGSEQSGSIFAPNGVLATVNIIGSVIGSGYDFTGVLYAQGLNKVTIGGDLVGGDNDAERDVSQSGMISAINGNVGIGSVEIKGDIIAGHDVDGTDEESTSVTSSGAIRSLGVINKLTVGGSLVGNESNDVLITAQANFNTSYEKNITIGSIAIGQNVDYALIIAGVNNGDLSDEDSYFNPFAQITSVTVGGHWHAGSIAAGAMPGPDGYGVGDVIIPNNIVSGAPQKNFSKIGTIVIGGQVTGGPEGEQFGFVAGSFDSIKVNNVAQVIPSSGSTSNVTTDADVKIHSVPWTPNPPDPDDD